VTAKKYTIEQAIEKRLANFIEKKKASSGARPCGPHDLAPVYLATSGLSKEEMRDERFFGRLRRSRI
jgi:hypothetical protein